jgi:outer membrane biosynthesis protein TonB
MDSRFRKYILLVSVFAHLVIFLLLNVAVEWKIIGLNLGPNPSPASEPIVFDMQNTDQPREVIETPQDARTVDQQKKADFLSDKNALARNPETKPDLKVGDSFSRGDFKSHDLPEPEKRGREPKPTEPERLDPDERPELKDYLEKNQAAILYKDYLFDQSREKNPGTNRQNPTVDHDQQESRALDNGGLSFNTYNWNFAPYMLALKRRIRNNIYPPVAFTRLGMISGETLLRFKIFPGGELRDLKILGYQGDVSLMKTSQTAVEISAPFPKLPPDFPEPYLEVTGRFLYWIKQEKKSGE